MLASIHYVSPQVKAFSAICTSIAVVLNMTRRLTNFVRKAFETKIWSIKPFVEPSIQIHLLSHEKTTLGSFTFGLRATTQVSWTPHIYSKY
jgi:hypothetical protein